jgi:hypothetical protein
MFISEELTPMILKSLIKYSSNLSLKTTSNIKVISAVEISISEIKLNLT